MLEELSDRAVSEDRPPLSFNGGIHTIISSYRDNSPGAEEERESSVCYVHGYRWCRCVNDSSVNGAGPPTSDGCSGTAIRLRHGESIP